MFSQRQGYSKPREVIQIDSIDEPTKNRLWNEYNRCYLNTERGHGIPYPYEIDLAHLVWDKFYKFQIDEFPPIWSLYIQQIKTYFIKQPWHKTFDLMEFSLAFSQSDSANKCYSNDCNQIFQEEMVGYRFVDKFIVPITSNEEISAIEESLDVPLDQVHQHLATALAMLANRSSPDYRNSIKESISAVEAICRILTKSKAATLGDALDILKKRGNLNSLLKTSFEKLYVYTNGPAGIRHALMEDDATSQNEAKFMLVACSAFVNYIAEHARKLGLELT